MHSAIQILLLLICTWMLVSWLQQQLGGVILLALILLAFLAAATAFSLRFRRQWLAGVYQYPGVRQWIDLIARLTGLQCPSVETPTSELSPEIQVRLDSDFAWLQSKLEQRVDGQAAAIVNVVEQLRQAFALRSRLIPSAQCGPLAVLLWVGAPGIGKRTLAAELAQRVYRNFAFSEWDLARSPSGQTERLLIGDSSTEGQLVHAARLKPFQVLFLDNVQTATPALRNTIRQMIETGCCFDAKHRGEVSFRQTILIVSVSDPRLAERPAGSPPTDQVRMLCAEFGLEPGFVASFPSVIPFSPLEDLDKGRVVARLMSSECEKYGLQLDYVDAELIAGEIRSLTAEHGFELTQVRLRQALKTPIQRACENGQTRLAITVGDVPRNVTGIDR